MSSHPLLSTLPDPVILESIEALRGKGSRFVRVRSTNGAEGFAPASERLDYLYPLFQQRVAPYFIRKDARTLSHLVEGVYLHQSNYKLAGIAFWCCVGWIDSAVMDLLGRIAEKPVWELLGGQRREALPVYLSSMRRDTTPQEEVAWLQERVGITGARAVKVKIGGRMSGNADASPGRSEELIRLARTAFGDDFTLYADANGSYDASHAVAVGQMLEDYGVVMFEEPCPWEAYAQTQHVTQALRVPVAGGEQDSSWHRFRDMVAHHVVDILQPDLDYNGGFLRTLRVAELAAASGMPVTPHSPRSDANWVTLLHFVPCISNAGPYHEYNADQVGRPVPCEPSMQVLNGEVAVPTGPGLGLTHDPAILKALETY
jgi:L-alanine-DL-glutamate epimerase-like enolase superfamily enzyme